MNILSFSFIGVLLFTKDFLQFKWNFFNQPPMKVSTIIHIEDNWKLKLILFHRAHINLLTFEIKILVLLLYRADPNLLLYNLMWGGLLASHNKIALDNNLCKKKKIRKLVSLYRP